MTIQALEDVAMKRGPASRTGVRALLGGVAVGALVVAGIAAAPPALAKTAVTEAKTPDQAVAATKADQTALIQAYVMARKLPRDAVSGIRKDSLRVATDPATGESWAIAAFSPAGSASAKIKDEFQDGASIAVFTRTATTPWRLSRITGAPYTCSTAIPAAALAAWHLSRLASCGTSAATERAAATNARTTLLTKAGVASAAVKADTAKSAAAATDASGLTLGQQIANIALAQVGVSDTPSFSYFGVLDCDPYSTLVGPPAPNGNGCGVNSTFNVVNENEEWCSDLSKWVWIEAGITADINTLNAGSNSFYAWGSDQGEPLAVDSGTPAVGDAIVFYEPGTVALGTYADHVGIVTGINSDGTINMVNGDFAGGPDIAVQYDTEIDLTTWASEVWSPGEQWVIVSPPTTAQQPAPTAKIIAPKNAVAGTSVPFAATAAEHGGSISSYLWTFGDGGTSTSQVTSHVFANPGLYTVALTATSSLGTVTIETQDVDVVGTSSAVASTPNYDVWYTTDPLIQDVYLPTASGGLSEEADDSVSWLDQAIPGEPGATGATATLNYPNADDTTAAQVFFRAADGNLAQTSGGDGNWSTSELVGQPAAASDIVATTVNDPTSERGAAPEVFYFDGSGQLTESSGVGGTWTTQSLPGPATTEPGALAVADATVISPQTLVFYADGKGSSLTVTSSTASGAWRTEQIRSPFGVAAGTPLTALSTQADGLLQSVFFVDGRGHVAEATSTLGTGIWVVTQLPGPAASTAGLAAGNYQLASGQTSAQVFYLDSAGTPVEESQSGLSWSAATLPGTATGILGAGTYPADGGSEQLFLSDAGSVDEDATTGAGSSWAESSLPNTPVTYAGRILLYAAAPTDYADSLAAAAAAGLPADQVTDNFAAAWAATLSGNYLVIAIGVPAVDALYVNECGWANPSEDDPGTTPFYYYVPPFYGLPGADAFVNATAASSSQEVAAATDAAYYALNDALPPGVTSIPTLTGSDFECEGSPD